VTAPAIPVVTEPARDGGTGGLAPPRGESFKENALFLFGLLPALGLLVLTLVQFTSPAQSNQWSKPLAFFAGLCLFSAVRRFLLFTLSFCALKKIRAVRGNPAIFRPVSILVPCFNEARTIGPALQSLLELDYPEFEIIVVNDGSTDDTLAQARKYEGEFGQIRVEVLDKPNGGKWSALNLGFRRARGEWILCVDADSRLEPEALKRMSVHFNKPRIWGVAGQVRVRNRRNLITRLQALEYLLGNGSVRLSQSLFGTVLVVPGPIGLFPRATLEKVWAANCARSLVESAADISGPFNGDTFAEDFDLSLAILRLGGRIAYEPLAISHTRAPETAYRLINQRYRWMRGSMQVLKKLLKGRKALPEFRGSAAPAWLAFTYLPELFLFPMLYFLALGAAFYFGLSGELPISFLYWFLSFGLVEIAAAFFYCAIHGDSAALLMTIPFYSFYNGFLISSAWLISILDEFRGKKMRW